MIAQKRLDTLAKLKQCPLSYCGSTADMYSFKEYDNTHYKVICRGCGLSTVLHLTEDDAIKSWNH